MYKEDSNIRHLSSQEIEKIKELEENVRKAEETLKSYKKSLLVDKGCKKILGILSYVTRTRKWTLDKLVEKSYTMLAYISSWGVYSEEIRPYYSHVREDGSVGNSIDTTGKYEFEFVPLEDCTLDEAKRILKDVKKKSNI